MKVLVIGGSGLLGGAVGREAAEAGHRVVATYATRAPCSHPLQGAAAWDWHQLELSVPLAGSTSDPARRLIRTVAPDAVVNCAYVPSGPLLGPVTGDAPGRIAAAADEVGARFIHISTDVVFDGRLPAGSSYAEDATPNPVHEYGRAKLRAEWLVSGHSPQAAIVRTSLLLPGAPEAAVKEALAATDGSGTPAMTFFTDEFRSPCQATDLARFLIWLATDPAGREVAGIVHAAGSITLSRFQLAAELAANLGLDSGRLIGGPRPVDGPPRPSNCSLRTIRGLPGLPLPGVEPVGFPGRMVQN